jgi:hypothetical protein
MSEFGLSELGLVNRDRARAERMTADIVEVRTMLQEMLKRQSEILRQQAELLELLRQAPAPLPPKGATRPMRATKKAE